MIRHLTLLILFLSLPPYYLARTVDVRNFAELVNSCRNALPGDTILLAPGVYTIQQMSRILISGRPGPVIVKGATGNPADVIVEGLGQDDPAVEIAFNMDDSPEWTFQDFTTRNTYYHGFKFDHGSTDCVLRNIVMRDHGSSGVKGTSDPQVGRYPDRLLIERCDIAFTNSSGGTRSVVEGIDGVGVIDWIIRNNRFKNIQRNGKDAYAVFTKGNSSNTLVEANYFENCFVGASFGGGGSGDKFFRDLDSSYEQRYGIIRNNVIVDCSDAAIYVNRGLECKIFNNTILNCLLTIQLRYESSGLVCNNLVKRHSGNTSEPLVRLRNGAVLIADKANLEAHYDDFIDPLKRKTQMDLHLSPKSRAIDAGVDLGKDVPTDFEGIRRPQGDGFDVGAYETPVVHSSTKSPRTKINRR